MMDSFDNSNLKKPIVITPPTRLEFPNLREVFKYQDLLWLLVRRDLKVRFQQTLIGFLWILLQPIINMLIFYVILGILVKVPTGDIPYPVFFLSGFVVWQLFSQIVNACAYSLLWNVGVITKSYFPRLVLPISATFSSIVDFLISFGLLLVFLIANHYQITARFLLLPIILVITLLFSSGIGLLFGALMVVFRDTKNFLSFIMTIWMYITPVMFPVLIVPLEYQILFYINPLTSLVEIFRWMSLGTGTIPDPINLFVSFIVALGLWFAGAIAFRAMENKIADVM